MKPKMMGFIDNGTGLHQSNQVWDVRYVSPTITTIDGGTQQIKILTMEDLSKKFVFPNVYDAYNQKMRGGGYLRNDNNKGQYRQ